VTTKMASKPGESKTPLSEGEGSTSQPPQQGKQQSEAGIITQTQASSSGVNKEEKKKKVAPATQKEEATTTKKEGGTTSTLKDKADAKKAPPVTKPPQSFPRRLQSLSHRLESMITLCGRTAAGLNQVYSAERAYCVKSLQHIMKERAETKSMQDFSAIEPVASAWVATEKLFDADLNSRAKFAEEVITKVVTPLNNWIVEARRKHKAITVQQQAWKRELHKNEDEVIGNREICRELLESCVRAQQDELKKKDEQTSQGGISFLSKFTMGVAELYRGTLPDLHRKVQIAITDYNKKIEIANKRMERYIRADLIRVCHEFRQLTVTTVANVKTFLGTFHQINLDHGKRSPQVENLGKLLESMNAAGGLPALLKRAEEDHKKSLPKMLQQQKYTYELGVTVDMVKQQVYSIDAPKGKKPQPPSIFSSSLDRIMKIQRENRALRASQRKLGIPTPMEALMKYIKQLGGLQEEGIFRLSASKEDVQALAAALDKGFIAGKYQFFNTSPHVPAVMLKRWLRSLKEPLVPSKMYAQAQHLVRPDGGYSSGEPSESLKKEARAFVANLPTIHRNVLIALIKFAHEVAQNEQVNRMNLSNLAVVLGPCVIRNPKPNAQNLVQDARSSGAFVKLLLLSHQIAPSAPASTTTTGSTSGEVSTAENDQKQQKTTEQHSQNTTEEEEEEKEGGKAKAASTSKGEPAAVEGEAEGKNEGGGSKAEQNPGTE